MSSGDVGVLEFFSRCNEVFSWFARSFPDFFCYIQNYHALIAALKHFFFKFCLLLCLKSLLSIFNLFLSLIRFCPVGVVA